MQIYKIRGFVKHTFKRKDGTKEYTQNIEYDFEEVIIDNLQNALEVYASVKNKCTLYAQYSNRFGFCELFIPKIFPNGTIANFPKDEVTYIARQEW